ncbi:MAG TPA: hypothetical protein VFS43_43810 [Polyangiaceae bacterium]|nr:hypothetical protein [Polyangiaceae bacterium]
MIHLRVLRFFARRPLSVGAVLLAVVLGVGAAGAWLAGAGAGAGATPAGPQAPNPRMLISRVWLDRYPEKARDEVSLFIFFGSGFGIYEHGSRYRATTEFFEFERQGDSVEITFLHDKSRHKTRFALTACQDDENFDLCLDLASSPRGPSRYYSWGDEDEDEERLSWLAAWKRGAEERARARR